jgi:phage FluMu protein Com
MKEQFAFTDFVIYGTQKSRIRPGYSSRVEIGVGCPRCNTVNMPAIEHAEECTCKKCGLHLQRFGNCLEVWADETELDPDILDV